MQNGKLFDLEGYAGTVYANLIFKKATETISVLTVLLYNKTVGSNATWK